MNYYRYALIVDYGHTMEYKGIFRTYKEAREKAIKDHHPYPFFILDVKEVTNSEGKIVDMRSGE